MKKEHRVLYGSSEEWIELRARAYINEALSEGWEVEYLDGKKAKKGDISSAFERGLFDDSDKLIVVENPTSIKTLSELPTLGGSFAVLFLCGKVCPKALMGVKAKESLDHPKGSKKRAEWYATFFREMLLRHGKEVSLPICKSVVQRVGQDLGVLRYEAMKIAYASEGKEVTPKEVMSVLAPLSEMSGILLIDAVFSWNPSHFLKVCERFEQNRKTDPTMGICTGLFYLNVVELLKVRFCLDNGVTSLQGIAEELGKEMWLVESVLVPRAKSFSTKKLREILGLLYHCENLALSGVVSPFSAFKTGVVRLMIS